MANEILRMTVEGFAVRQVLVAEKLDIRAEYYLGITVDREAKSVVLIISDAGGMDIEQIAAHQPQRVRRFTLAGGDGPRSNTLEQWLSVLFTDQVLLDQVVSIVQNIHRFFRDKDCSLVEVNPLALTAGSRLIAADAKIVFDDNALWRHPDIARLRNEQEYTQDELQAKDAGLSFVSLSGEIGCMVNGAGLAMATIDGIKLAGGSAANFLDVGGSSSPGKVLSAMRILLGNTRLKVILVNIFGGITRCDDVAQGILAARQRLGIPVPMVIRLVGTNEQQARDMLRRGLPDAQDAAGGPKADLIVASEMTEAIREAVNLAKKGGGA